MRLVTLLTALLLSNHAVGHEMRPGYLVLSERTAGVVDVEFRQPVTDNRFLELTLKNCEPLTEPVHRMSGGTMTQTWQARCETRLANARVAILGLAGTSTEVLVNVRDADGTEASHIIRPDAPVLALGHTEPPLLPVYLGLGIEHLLTGLDHVLFIIALLVLVTDKWKLVQTITAFTLAHSITLALSALDVIRLPQGPVEAAIALSILYVAVEITREDARSPTRRAPWLIAFVFGLLHGLGFAGVLREIGLPDGETLWALLLFNAGIEVGQLMIVGVFITALFVARHLPAPGMIPRGDSAALRLVPAYFIGPVAAFWMLQRLVA